MKKIYLLLLLCLASNISSDPAGLENILRFPAKHAENYSFDLTSDLSSRVKIAPDFLINYLEIGDSTDRYDKYTLSVEDALLVEIYLTAIPAKFQDMMKQKCIGLFFVKDFMGGGMTDFVFDKSGNMYVYMILNPAILKTPLSEWIWYRDTSTFRMEEKYKISNSLGREYMGLIHTL
ncbi:MAG: hypothetical protein EHM28_12995, partial [Spirochaetaceae bacterium]